MKISSLFIIVFLCIFNLNAQTFQEVYLEAEIDPSGQALAKEMCKNKGMPLSIYVDGEALIEAIMIKENNPLYGVIVNFLSPMDGGYLATFEEIESQFDIENAQRNYGNGRIINDRSSFRHNSNPTLPGQYLLIPESTNDRVMAFDPITGDLLDADFIPTDPDNLSTPIAARPMPGNPNLFLVSDQIDDAIQSYDENGAFVSTFAGGDVSILDNIRGIGFNKDSSSILVTVGGGANDDAIAEFDLNGNYQGNFITNGLGGLNSPFDIVYHPQLDQYLVGGITSDAIHIYDTNGAYVGDFAPLNTFPEQITVFEDGSVGVANFSGTQEGVLIYNQLGVLQNALDPAALGGYRGVYLLGNGNILTTNGGGVHEVDMSGNLVDTKIAGVSARFITEGILYTAPIPTLGQWGIIILSFLLLIGGALSLKGSFLISQVKS
jgi:hypothetical protein